MGSCTRPYVNPVLHSRSVESEPEPRATQADARCPRRVDEAAATLAGDVCERGWHLGSLEVAAFLFTWREYVRLSKDEQNDEKPQPKRG